jgi:ferredoxin
METPCIVHLICELYAPSVFTLKSFKNINVNLAVVDPFSTTAGS